MEVADARADFAWFLDILRAAEGSGDHEVRLAARRIRESFLAGHLR